MNSGPKPRLALSEAAISLIRQAENAIPATLPGPDTRRRILVNAMGVSTDPEEWHRQTSLIRLISIIETYVDAVSMYRMNELVDSQAALIPLLLRDFELTSSSSWQSRHDSYREYHGLNLRNLTGWEQIKAGIEVRNCLLHGMGKLTAKQRQQTKLSTTVKSIDVTIDSNQMHIGARTIKRVGLTPFRRSSRYESRPVARGRGQGDWSDHDEQQEASHPGAGRP